MAWRIIRPGTTSKQPKTYSLLYNIGYCYEMMEDYKNAISYYERLLKKIPIVEITAKAPASKEVDDHNFVLNGELSQEEALHRGVSLRIERLQKELFFQSKGNKAD